MDDDSADDMDKMLKEAAARWRASLPPVPDGPTMTAALPATDGAMSNWSAVAGALGIVCVVGVGALVFIGGKLGLSLSGTPGSNQAGVEVVAAGTIVARANDRTLLCVPLDDDLVEHFNGDPRTRCSSLQVQLQDLDLAAIPNPSADGSAVVSRFAVVRGLWTGAEIRVSSVGGPAPVQQAPPNVSCSSRVPGAQPETSQDLENEAAHARLQAEVEGEPTLYAGLWPQAIDGRRSMVVATVAPPETTVARLRAIFPFEFCVVQVKYATSDLERTVAAFGPDKGYVAAILPSANRVVVQMVVVDDAAASLLSTHPAAIAKALVVPVGSPR